MPSAIVNLSAGKSTSEEKGEQEDFCLNRESETNKRNALLHTVLDSPSAIISTPLQEPTDLVRGSDQIIDLNKTPQQKPPKRKKHRPKVIVEGKPKRTHKVMTPRSTDSKEKPTGKRKYVRKKGLQESITQPRDSVGEVTNPSTGKRVYVQKNSLEKTAIQHEDFTGETKNPSPSVGKRKYVRKNILDKTGIQQEDFTGETTTPSPSVDGKRKYVRKKSLQESTIQHKDSLQETTNANAGRNCVNQGGIEQAAIEQTEINAKTAYSSPGTAQKSCRRALNFESEGRGIQNSVAAQEDEKLKESFNLNVGFESPEPSSGANKLCKTMPVSQVSQQNLLQLENQQSITMINLTTSMNHIHSDRIQISGRQITAAQLDLSKDGNTKNNKRGIVHNVQIGVGQPMMPPFSVEVRGSEREPYHWMRRSLCGASPAGSSLLCQERIHVEGYNQNTNVSSPSFSETHKRRKVENGIQTDTYANLSATMSRRNYEMSSRFGSDNVKNRENTGSNKIVGNQIQRMASDHNFPKQYPSLEFDSCRERTGEINTSAQDHSLVLPLPTKTCVMPPPPDPKSGPVSQSKLLPKTGHNVMPKLLQTVASSTLSKSTQSRKGRIPKTQKDLLEEHPQSSAKQQVPPSKQKFSDQIEEVIHCMQSLNLNGQENALVPYQGNGAVVPHGDSEGIKKHKPRPKVDLDPETERVWKLLMGKEGGEGLEGSEKGKEQWWQNEREVFRLRVDSFIARMHLVQGDRRFSKWKGSVVDSVIGVFLTQNVSDHLSSSAFMSLASLFPLKSKRNRTYGRDERSIVIEEPDDSMLNSNGAIKMPEKLNFPVYIQSSVRRPISTSILRGHGRSLEEEVVSSQESVGSSIIQVNGGVISYAGSNSEVEDPASGFKTNKNFNFSYTDLLTSAVPFEEYGSPISGSSFFQEVSEVGYEQTEETQNGYQRSNFENLGSVDYPSALNQKINYRYAKPQVPAGPSSTYMLHPTEQHTLEEAVLRLHGEASTSWPSTASTLANSKRVVQGVETACKSATDQYTLQNFKENPQMYPQQQSSCEIHNSFLHHRNQPQEWNNNFQSESTPVVEPANHAEALVTKQGSYRQTISNISKLSGQFFATEEGTTSVHEQMHFNNKLVEQNSKEQVHSKGIKNMEASANTSKGRKGKAESEKKDAIDWDSLRKKVPENRRKVRSSETMDSLDYEALRSASVKQISDAIKERGMNNMLAERIKDFLDRVVREHGSIDLEWLREVPPDKAKEFLLSIRGLGLKSVECVRLLTLHHLAFPVDTNVGRIAVRLGWVPLQPLPESLQLHLLELYPVLETIQKYLWPRLCKLDQRTLYELHYQMITFGKVFCTKNRPNCNACPMRAECRHFASAFASARLALPGPEEKSITTSTAPFSAERNPGIVINPIPLLPPEDKSLTITGSYTSNCVPIVEEPATPDQDHNEVTESDIEDAFYDDPDEIPTINLNMEKFSQSLQNYMQGSMELQEGDLSKALVVLNPGAASIPTPKLKNISRLRTEHQVYELPDSHPLLKEMDRREPDDPSPYLLAIWSPGETANSIEPPEQLCQSQEQGKLCHENTCFSCNNAREANSQTVRGTILIPCRTAMRGSFPLNGTYFQVNEVFADHESSLKPIDVPRNWIWNLPRRMVYFGTSVTTIFKGLSTEGIQYCFWKGFVCVRGFDQKTRAPRPLMARLHFPASKLVKPKNQKT